jgi:predicted phosphodiesterase
MRIQLASDLHLEHLHRRFPRETLIRPARDADVLVLAGDIANGTQAIDLFRAWPVPVIYVSGNHELYHRTYEDVFDDLRERAYGTSICFLERDVADFGGVRFVGCTLWTDYRLLEGMQAVAMRQAGRSLNDHRVISTRNGEEFSPRDALNIHHESRTWLHEQLTQQYDGVTVVVSHHGPHPQSVHPRYFGDLLNGAFVSDLTPLLANANFWLHGHVHDSFDYEVRGCHVLTNPAGYARNASTALNLGRLELENENFEYVRLIDTADLARAVRPIGKEHP